MKNQTTSINLKVIDALYKAFTEGDIPTVLGLMDEKIIWNEAEGNALAIGNPYIGPEAILNGVFIKLAEEHEYFNTKNVELHEMYDDKVLATLRYDAKRKGNGALINAQAAHFWTIKSGKIVAFQQYVNTKQLADAANK
ncbi:nuclear transport factor 2 family protein [Maribacter thermophilus]|uniref:nuclear transport factor 2 family protein n=1 Tax=Maribacter thermophilus TaxID=1197874 RepID=UPI000640DEB1|nr:nuclear transport factor 2 family protein [Maribacter thermophilus]